MAGSLHPADSFTCSPRCRSAKFTNVDFVGCTNSALYTYDVRSLQFTKCMFLNNTCEQPGRQHTHGAAWGMYASDCPAPLNPPPPAHLHSPMSNCPPTHPRLHACDGAVALPRCLPARSQYHGGELRSFGSQAQPRAGAGDGRRGAWLPPSQ